MNNAETTAPRKRYKVRPLEGEELATAQAALDEWHQQFKTDEHSDRLEQAKDKLDIVEFVYYLLKEKGMSQKELAERMGVTESTVSRILSGEHNPTLETIRKIKRALGEDIILTPLTALQNARVKVAAIRELCSEGYYVQKIDSVFLEVEVLDVGWTKQVDCISKNLSILDPNFADNADPKPSLQVC